MNKATELRLRTENPGFTSCRVLCSQFHTVTLCSPQHVMLRISTRPLHTVGIHLAFACCRLVPHCSIFPYFPQTISTVIPIPFPEVELGRTGEQPRGSSHPFGFIAWRDCAGVGTSKNSVPVPDTRGRFSPRACELTVPAVFVCFIQVDSPTFALKDLHWAVLALRHVLSQPCVCFTL